jgi:hypothetical protein
VRFPLWVYRRYCSVLRVYRCCWRSLSPDRAIMRLHRLGRIDCCLIINAEGACFCPGGGCCSVFRGCCRCRLTLRLCRKDWSSAWGIINKINRFALNKYSRFRCFLKLTRMLSKRKTTHI